MSYLNQIQKKLDELREIEAQLVAKRREINLVLQDAMEQEEHDFMYPHIGIDWAEEHGRDEAKAAKGE